MIWTGAAVVASKL